MRSQGCSKGKANQFVQFVSSFFFFKSKNTVRTGILEYKLLTDKIMLHSKKFKQTTNKKSENEAPPRVSLWPSGKERQTLCWREQQKQSPAHTAEGMATGAFFLGD